MSIIETEIWESNPEDARKVQYVGQRKSVDVFNELCDYLKKENLYPDEYFLLDSKFENNEPLPKIEDVICYAQWGGSEGIYLEVEFSVKNNEGEYKLVKFATGKSLGESGEDYDRMQNIAGKIYKAFTSEGQNFGKSPDMNAIQYNGKSKMTKKEVYRAIHNIEDTYGLLCFRCALSHLLFCGQRELSDRKAVIKTQEEIRRTLPKNSIVTADFRCRIIDCAAELGQFNSYDLFRYIKTNVSTGEWNNDDI